MTVPAQSPATSGATSQGIRGSGRACRASAQCGRRPGRGIVKGFGPVIVVLAALALTSAAVLIRRPFAGATPAGPPRPAMGPGPDHAIGNAAERSRTGGTTTAADAGQRAGARRLSPRCRARPRGGFKVGLEHEREVHGLARGGPVVTPATREAGDQHQPASDLRVGWPVHQHRHGGRCVVDINV